LSSSSSSGRMSGRKGHGTGQAAPGSGVGPGAGAVRIVLQAEIVKDRVETGQHGQYLVLSGRVRVRREARGPGVGGGRTGTRRQPPSRGHLRAGCRPARRSR
jgi:hypothetical protein